MAISEEIQVSVSGLGQVGALADGLDKAAEAAAKLRESLGSMSVGGAAGGSAGVTRMATAMDKAALKTDAAISKMEKSFARLDGIGAGAAASLGDVGKVAAENAAGLGDAAKAANDAATGYARLGKAAGESAAAMDGSAVAGGRSVRRVSETAAAHEKFWKGVKVAAVSGAVGIAYGIDQAMKLQTQVTRLYTAAGLKGVKPGTVDKDVLGIGSKTGFSGTDIAEAMYHPVSAGLDYKTSKGLTEQSANLANIHGANLDDTTYAMSSVMKAYNEKAKDVIPTAALLNSIVGQGDMRFQSFNQSIKNWAPTGASMGISVQSMGAGLAYLTDRGNDAEVASTRLTMGLSMATAGSKAANTYLRDLGLTTGSLDLKNKSLQKTMEAGGLTTNKFASDLKKPDGLYVALSDMQGAFTKAGLSKGQADQVMSKIFGGGRSDKAIVSLMQNLDGLRQKYNQIGQDATPAKYMSAVAKEQATAQQKWKDFLASGKNLAAGFGNAMLPTFTKIAGGAANLLQGSGGKVAGGVLGGAMALFAGNKLFHGAESTVGTLGKLGKFLNIPGMGKLSGVGQAAGSTSATTGLDAVGAAADGAAGALGRLGGAAGGKGLAGAGAPGSKLGSALGTGLMAAAGAWLIGHGIGAMLPKSTTAEQAAYQKNIPGWLQSPTNFVFGSKAASLYQHLPSARDLLRDIGLGSAPPARPATPRLTFADGKPFYGEVDRSRPVPKNFRADIPVGLPAPVPNYPDGRPFYGEVPRGVAKPAPAYPSGQPFYGEVPRGVARPAISATPVAAGKLAALSQPVNVKPIKIPPPDTSAIAGAMAKIKAMTSQQANVKPIKIPAPDTSALAGVKAKLAGMMSGVTIKPAKVPAPDMSGVDSAKGKAASAGSGITSAIQGAMHPAKMPAPDLSAASGAAGAAEGIGANISGGLAAGIRSGIGAIQAAAAAAAAAASVAMAAEAIVKSPSKKTEKIGKEMAAGLVVGLEGGTDAVSAAGKALSQAATKPADIASIDSTIAKLTKKIAGKPAMVMWLQGEQDQLHKLAANRTKLEAEITGSEQAAQSAISGASITNALNAVNPSGAEPIASSAIVQGQQYQASSMAAFAKQLLQLQKSGLNATSLSQIAQAGPEQGLGLAQGINSGGKQAITQLNVLQKQIHASASKIGDVAGVASYQSGKDIGQGLAQGLKDALKANDKEIEKIAKQAVSTIDKVSGPAKAKAKAAGKAAGGSGSGGSGSGSSSPAASGSAASSAIGGVKGWDGAAASLSAAGSALSAAAGALAGAAGSLKAAVASSTSAAKGGHPLGPGGVMHYPVSSGGGGGGGGTTVVHNHHYHIQGSVVTTKTLAKDLQGIFLDQGMRNLRTGLQPKGRGA